MRTAASRNPLAGLRSQWEPTDEASERILDGALHCLATFGLRRTTMDDIAEAARVGRATLYRRFAGRDEIVRAVALRELLRVIDALDEVSRSHDDPVERFVEGFVAAISLTRDHPLFIRLLELEPGLLLPVVTVQAGPGLAIARVWLEAELDRMRGEGALRDDVDTPIVAELLVRLCQSLLLTPDGLISIDDDDGLRRLATRHLVPVLVPDRRDQAT